MIRRRLALVLVLALLAACAGVGPPSVSVEERNAYREAVALRESDPAEAERRLEAFLRAWPESALAADVGMALGDIALTRGDREGALGHLYGVLRRDPDAERSDSARVEIARIERARGELEAAARVLSRARLSRLTPAERRTAYRVLADAAPNPVARLERLARLRALEDGDAVALIDVEIDELLLQLDVPQLESAAKRIGPEVPAARLRLRAGDLALEAGDVDRARRELERAEDLPIEPQYAFRREALSRRIAVQEQGPSDAAALPPLAEAALRGQPSTARAEGTLGVVLPLSGSFASFGEQSLNGVLLAAGVFDEGAGMRDGRFVRVLIRDSAGQPGRAAEAVRELAAQSDVSAIVGPLLSGECEAAAAEAEAAGVPLVTLTSRPEVARDRPNVFRVRTMPVEEIQLLVDHAMRELGARRFAILYPRDAYGRGERALFWDAVEARGGEVVAVGAFEPDATDFGEAIRRLAGYVLLSPEQKQGLGRREEMRRRARRLPADEARELRREASDLTASNGEPLPPRVDFDAIFIPDTHEKIVLIAPQLAFHDVVGVRLLGPNGWYAPDLVEIGRDHVEGARFSAHFYPESDLPLVRRFTQAYTETFRTPPDLLAAQGFDAANLVLVQLARGRHARPDVRDGVLAVRTYPGVTGVLSMGADGNAHKRPFLLGVEGGRIVSFD